MSRRRELPPFLSSNFDTSHSLQYATRVSTLRHSSAEFFANPFGHSRILFVAIAVLVAHLLLIVPASPPAVAAAAAFVLLIAAPGLLLASLLMNDAQEPLPAAEWISYGIGGGFGAGTLTVLLVGLLPGPLNRLLLLAACDGLLLVLFLLLWRQRRHHASSPAPLVGSTQHLRWAALGGLLVLLVAGTRLANLGYSQLQGDEATPIVRAEGFVQDHENAVFLQPRGPLDMMIPAGIMVLSGSRTELALRLPFALANATVTLAVWSLGAALAGSPVGWLGALLYALDGYAVAFGRVMHYESVILLVTTAAVLALYRAVDRQRQRGSEASIGGYLRVTALLAATGLLSHYDGSLILLLGAYLLFVLWREGMAAGKLGRLLLAPTALALALTIPFYAAFVLNPNFADTLGRYSQSLVEESGMLVNSLLYFAESTALYYGPLGFYFMAFTLWLAAAHVFWSQRRRPWAGLFLALTLTLPLVMAAQALGVVGRPPYDLTPIWIGVIGAAILLARGVSVEERLLWIWFVVQFYA